MPPPPPSSATKGPRHCTARPPYDAVPPTSPLPLANINLRNFLVQLVYTNGSYDMPPFASGRLLSLSAMIARLIHTVVSTLHFLLRLNNIPLYGQTSGCSSILPLMDNWVVSIFCLLAFATRAVMNVCVCILVESLFLILWGIHLGVELWAHVVIRFTF